MSKHILASSSQECANECGFYFQKEEARQLKEALENCDACKAKRKCYFHLLVVNVEVPSFQESHLYLLQLPADVELSLHHASLVFSALIWAMTTSDVENAPEVMWVMDVHANPECLVGKDHASKVSSVLTLLMDSSVVHALRITLGTDSAVSVGGFVKRLLLAIQVPFSCLYFEPSRQQNVIIHEHTLTLSYG